MTFEDWWDKKAPNINRALKSNHEYIKPFFENAYVWGNASHKERENISPQWINTQHLHCKECGRIIECAGRIEWNVDVGVRAYGVCSKCNLMLIQYEKQSKNKWIKI